jgi:hypothetical protein
MRLTLEDLEWVAEDTCRARFTSPTGDHEVVFRLDRSSIGIVANPDPDIFLECGGSAQDIRSIVSTVVEFCLQNQGEQT